MRVDTEQSAETLVTLIRSSLASGHRRVALQRIFMLRRLQGVVPDDLNAVISEGLVHLPTHIIRRMDRAAIAWVSMLRLREW